MAATTPASDFPPNVLPFTQRKLPTTICMFDVDETLTKARQLVKPSMRETLEKLRGVCAIAFVGGSNLVKQREQLEAPGTDVLQMFDYCFSENGLIAYKLGKELASQSFIGWIGEEEYKKLVNWTLRYLSEVDIPIKRGTFIEFRNGMINISPVGRNASKQERDDFEKFDKEHGIRPKMIEELKKAFPHLAVTYSIGGQISFDVFPTGWDKTYSLNHVIPEGFKEIHFFGDKCFKGGNDYEIWADERTVGHSVEDPDHTERLIKELFLSK